MRRLLATGDPHMTGFHGQKFDFTGKDGEWYALISDLPSIHINMRVTAPVPSLPEITYITGLSVFTTDSDGDDHSIIISVKTPHSLRSECPSDGSVCLADGALSVILDGEETFTKPGTEILAPGVEISVANIPGECRSFGFEQYWERKKLEAAQGRRLQENETMGDWILGDPTMTNVNECIEYVNDAMDGDTLFDHQSEHASFRIVTPTVTIRLSHGRLHQVAMRDPTDKFDLPDHLTWQMNMAIDHNDISRDAQGILGETFVPTLDNDGNKIMHGMESIRGTEADCKLTECSFPRIDCSFCINWPRVSGYSSLCLTASAYTGDTMARSSFPERVQQSRFGCGLCVASSVLSSRVGVPISELSAEITIQ